MSNKEKKNTEEKNIHDGHRNRMRERIKKTGFKGMQEHEILEVLLYYSVPRKDTNPIAHRLINRFGSIAGVFDASEDQLLMVDGITQNSATLIKMLVPLFHEYKKQKKEGVRLTNEKECAKFLCDYYHGINNETITVLCLDSSCKILAFEPICEGDCSNVMVNCRRVIEIVFTHANTTSVIISHNHPNGVALPSREDIYATNELIRMLKSVSISLADHIIVAGDEYVSLATSAVFKGSFSQLSK